MAEPAKESLGQWLYGVCNKEGLSLRQAGAKTGLSHSTIADIMKGVQVSAETIRKLATGFAENGQHERLALEDHLFILAGYRTPRPEGEEPRQTLGQLIDKLAQFDDRQLKLVRHFADYISNLEAD